VIHEVEDVDDVEAWRAAIRRQARADKIKVRTGCNEGIVWALRVRADQSGSQTEALRYRELLRRTVPLRVRKLPRSGNRAGARREPDAINDRTRWLTQVPSRAGVLAARADSCSCMG
jgi:hypothetical protein